MRDKRGFSIIEVMIVVAILGILSAIAYPLYNRYLQSGQRSEATASLEQLRMLEEEFRSLNGTYGTDGTYVGTAAIQGPAATPFLPDWQPPNGGAGMVYNYCIVVSNGGQDFLAGAIPGASAPADAVVHGATGSVATIDQINTRQGANFW